MPIWELPGYGIRRPERRKVISQEFDCLCGKSKGWITEGEKTQPCPHCGKVYLGVYNKKTLQIEGKAIDNPS